VAFFESSHSLYHRRFEKYLQQLSHLLTVGRARQRWLPQRRQEERVWQQKRSFSATTPNKGISLRHLLHHNTAFVCV
jgi:hypothetical protein